MNASALNQSAFNTAQVDPSIRIAVNVAAYALAVVLGRVFRRDVVASVASAQVQAGASLVARLQSALFAMADAAVLTLVMRRAPSAAQARAQVELNEISVRSRVLAVARALIVVAPRLAHRAVVSAQGVAQVQAALLRLARAPLEAFAAADVVAVGTRVPRRYLRDAIFTAPAALVVARLAALIRLVGAGTARAQISASPRVQVRVAAAATASAAIFVRVGSVWRVPFDEPADPDNVYVVPAQDNVFYVR